MTPPVLVTAVPPVNTPVFYFDAKHKDRSRPRAATVVGGGVELAGHVNLIVFPDTFLDCIQSGAAPVAHRRNVPLFEAPPTDHFPLLPTGWACLRAHADPAPANDVPATAANGSAKTPPAAQPLSYQGVPVLGFSAQPSTVPTAFPDEPAAKIGPTVTAVPATLVETATAAALNWLLSLPIWEREWGSARAQLDQRDDTIDIKTAGPGGVFIARIGYTAPPARPEGFFLRVNEGKKDLLRLAQGANPGSDGQPGPEVRRIVQVACRLAHRAGKCKSAKEVGLALKGVLKDLASPPVAVPDEEPVPAAG